MSAEKDVLSLFLLPQSVLVCVRDMEKREPCSQDTQGQRKGDSTSPRKLSSFLWAFLIKLLVLGILRSQIILDPIDIRNELWGRILRVGYLAASL